MDKMELADFHYCICKGESELALRKLDKMDDKRFLAQDKIKGDYALHRLGKPAFLNQDMTKHTLALIKAFVDAGFDINAESTSSGTIGVSGDRLMPQRTLLLWTLRQFPVNMEIVEALLALGANPLLPLTCPPLYFSVMMGEVGPIVTAIDAGVELHTIFRPPRPLAPSKRCLRPRMLDLVFSTRIKERGAKQALTTTLATYVEEKSVVIGLEQLFIAMEAHNEFLVEWILTKLHESLTFEDESCIIRYPLLEIFMGKLVSGKAANNDYNSLIFDGQVLDNIRIYKAYKEMEVPDDAEATEKLHAEYELQLKPDVSKLCAIVDGFFARGYRQDPNTKKRARWNLAVVGIDSAIGEGSSTLFSKLLTLPGINWNPNAERQKPNRNPLQIMINLLMDGDENLADDEESNELDEDAQFEAWIDSGFSTIAHQLDNAMGGGILKDFQPVQLIPLHTPGLCLLKSNHMKECIFVVKSLLEAGVPANEVNVVKILRYHICLIKELGLLKLLWWSGAYVDWADLKLVAKHHAKLVNEFGVSKELEEWIKLGPASDNGLQRLASVAIRNSLKTHKLDTIACDVLPSFRIFKMLTEPVLC